MAMTAEERNAKRRAAYAAKKNAESDKSNKKIQSAVVKMKNRQLVETNEVPAKKAWKDWDKGDQDQFLARVENEKKNIWRECQADPDKILEFCAKNKADEKRSAIRQARRAAVAWAVKQKPLPF